EAWDGCEGCDRGVACGRGDACFVVTGLVAGRWALLRGLCTGHRTSDAALPPTTANMATQKRAVRRPLTRPHSRRPWLLLRDGQAPTKSNAQPQITTPVSTSTTNAQTQLETTANPRTARTVPPEGRDVRSGRLRSANAESRGRESRRATHAPPRNRQRNGPAAGVPHLASTAPGGRSARGGDPGREGAGSLLPRVRQPHGGRRLRDLPRRAPRPLDHLRRRAAGRPDLARADSRVPRPVSRARWCALAARRGRAVEPADRRAHAPRRAERRTGGRARDEPEHDRRGDRGVSRGQAARP